MHLIKNIFIPLILSCMPAWSVASERILFDDNWKFHLSKSTKLPVALLDDSLWRLIDLPHDWAIEGDFHEKNPSGPTGGALPGGIGWYRKHFTLNDTDASTRYYIDFDGVFMNSSVYINGHLLGNRPYGYIGFRYDLTPYINKKGENVLSVCVDNSKQPNSRWYSGCGIYRHVYLIKNNDIHVGLWGINIKTKVQRKNASVDVNVELENYRSHPASLAVRYSIMDVKGEITCKNTCSVFAKEGKSNTRQRLVLNKPSLWSVDNPYLYRLKIEVIDGESVIDTQELPIGIRSFKFDPLTGFSLNGIGMKINGVCMHGDLGALGVAINEDALHRQLTMMKEMGVNAIRCSHNPPAPELLNMCDSMGFLVMDEAFDCWLNGKTLFDYGVYFNEWYERDLTDMVLRDRNHPSIIMWSIGNEVMEQWNTNHYKNVDLDEVNIELNKQKDESSLAQDNGMSENALLTRKLVGIVKQLDTSRPVTAGCNEVSPKNHLFKSGALDIIGFNYHHQNIADVPRNFPDMPFLFTESVSALQTRGYYMMPSDSIYRAPGKVRPYTDPTFMCSSYDNMQTSWGSVHEATWDVVKHTPYCSGQFIWTGWDYIGEPTPFAFPARSSYFGIVDLAGFPKDVYYMYQSEWTNKEVLHLFPHWNWLEGQFIDLWCYYNNADEVELYLNGISQGVRKKKEHEYHVMWRLQYEPGTVMVVSRKNGKTVKEQTIHTAGPPEGIRLSPDKTVLDADGKSLVFIKVEIIDRDGNLCPFAENQIFFSLDGQATIAGVDNGSQMSLERFQSNNRKAFFGRCLVIVKGGKQPSTIRLFAKSYGLKTAMAEFKSNSPKNLSLGNKRKN